MFPQFWPLACVHTGSRSNNGSTAWNGVWLVKSLLDTWIIQNATLRWMPLSSTCELSFLLLLFFHLVDAFIWSEVQLRKPGQSFWSDCGLGFCSSARRWNNSVNRGICTCNILIMDTEPHAAPIGEVWRLASGSCSFLGLSYESFT